LNFRPSQGERRFSSFVNFSTEFSKEKKSFKNEPPKNIKRKVDFSFSFIDSSFFFFFPTDFLMRLDFHPFFMRATEKQALTAADYT